jgi:hypothetical protein
LVVRGKMGGTLRSALGTCIALACACAHGVDVEPDIIGGGGASGSSNTSGGGGSSGRADGGATAGAAGSSAATGGAGGGSGGAATATGGSGGDAGATTGSAGAAGSSGGAAGAGGASAGAGGAGGAGGASGTGGGSGNGGSGGNRGGAGNGGGGGIVDAGQPLKPTSVTMGTSMSPVTQAPTTGGSSFNQRCGTDEVLIGYRGTVDSPDATVNYLRTFTAVCGKLSITGSGTYTVSTTQAEDLTTRGTQTGSIAQTAMCPANQVIVGFSGRQGNLIDSLLFTCAPLQISGSSPTFTLSIGATTNTTVIGGPGGTPFAPLACPANAVAVGHAGRSNQDVQAFGLVCAQPTLQVR